VKRAIRIGVLVLVFGLLFGLVIWNITYRAPISEEVWDEGTTIGDAATATRHYVQYSDFMCPYCDTFSREIIFHKEEFADFLAQHHILYEIRLTEMIHDTTGSEMSEKSAIAAYCALEEGKFVEYYDAGVMALWEDYHSKGIGNTKYATPIEDMKDDYWTKIGKSIGLGESFEDCVENQKTLEQVKNNTTRAEKELRGGGLPFFAFEKFQTAGIANEWSWEQTLKYLENGLH